MVLRPLLSAALQALTLFGAISALQSCASAWTPAQIDAVAAQCRTGIEKGTIAPRQSADVGIPAQPKPPGTPVEIYGASWCSACATAKAYLTRRGIPYVDHDVEDDASAAAARDAELTAVGLRPTGDIPVIDVRGTVTIGFFPCVIEKVW